MTKEHMLFLLRNHDGVGVEVQHKGSIIYYFYENFNQDDGIRRACKHFCNGENLTFYTASWAKKKEIALYMEQYRSNEEETKKEYYLQFIAEKIKEWTNCTLAEALNQVATDNVNYLAIS